jgi:predicted TIM-barrel fold metal-dependent hydrolase
MTALPRIDTHQHILPPFYSAWLRSQGIVDAGGRLLPEWSADSALVLMSEANIGTSIVSISTPGVHLGDDAQARDMARQANEFMADLVRQHPERFGFFAVLPLPDVEGAIAEARHALDVLKADGVMLLANVHGIYLGDPRWDPLMAELEQRHTVAFVHPSHLPGPHVPGIPAFAADFLLDTTRAAIQMAKNGVLERCPGLKIVLSHAGGFLPYAAERVARVCSPDGSNEAGIARLRRFWFDTALSSSPYALPALLAFAQPHQITYGSDWPFAPQERSLHFTGLLDQYPLNEQQRQSIDRLNALALIPRLQSMLKRA